MYLPKSLQQDVKKISQKHEECRKVQERAFELRDALTDDAQDPNSENLNALQDALSRSLHATDEEITLINSCMAALDKLIADASVKNRERTKKRAAPTQQQQSDALLSSTQQANTAPLIPTSGGGGGGGGPNGLSSQQSQQSQGMLMEYDGGMGVVDSPSGSQHVGAKKSFSALSPPDDVLAPGSQVAVRVSDQDLWLMAFVNSYSPERGGKYEVEDADRSADPTQPKKRWIAARHNVIPLPYFDPASPSLSPQQQRLLKIIDDLQPGALVLAMYPDTSFFYPAQVEVHYKKRKTKDWLLKFRDEDTTTPPTHKVPFHVVIPHPEAM